MTDTTHEAAPARLSERLRELEEENGRLADELVSALDQVAGLSALCAALERLHGTLDRAEVLAAIQEIVVNLVGSEEVAIYALDGETLRLAARFGAAGAPATVALGEGPIGGAAAESEARVTPQPAGSAAPTACVPLRAGHELVGVVAIFGLLPHKAGLGALDVQLLELLGRQAGSALHLTSLHARLAR